VFGIIVFKVCEFKKSGMWGSLFSSSNNPKRMTLFGLLKLEDETPVIIYRVQTRPKPLDIYGRKNSQHAFLWRGSKRICPMSQLCGMVKILVV
jgi:hypothetical protein